MNILILCNELDCKYCKPPYQLVCSGDKKMKGKCINLEPKIRLHNCIWTCASKNERPKLPKDLQQIIFDYDSDSEKQTEDAEQIINSHKSK